MLLTGALSLNKLSNDLSSEALALLSENNNEALLLSRQSVTSDPSNSYAWAVAGKVLLEIDRGNEALNYFKKSLLILKDFNKKNGYNYVSNLLEFMANWSLSNHNKALLNISQAIANFGKDTFDENETNMVWKMTIFGKSALEINLIDLYLFRSNIYSILVL